MLGGIKKEDQSENMYSFKHIVPTRTQDVDKSSELLSYNYVDIESNDDNKHLVVQIYHQLLKQMISMEELKQEVDEGESKKWLDKRQEVHKMYETISLPREFHFRNVSNLEDYVQVFMKHFSNRKFFLWKGASSKFPFLFVFHLKGIQLKFNSYFKFLVAPFHQFKFFGFGFQGFDTMIEKIEEGKINPNNLEIGHVLVKMNMFTGVVNSNLPLNQFIYYLKKFKNLVGTPIHQLIIEMDDKTPSQLKTQQIDFLPLFQVMHQQELVHRVVFQFSELISDIPISWIKVMKGVGKIFSKPVFINFNLQKFIPLSGWNSDILKNHTITKIYVDFRDMVNKLARHFSIALVDHPMIEDLIPDEKSIIWMELENLYTVKQYVNQQRPISVEEIKADVIQELHRVLPENWQDHWNVEFNKKDLKEVILKRKQSLI